LRSIAFSFKTGRRRAATTYHTKEDRRQKKTEEKGRSQSGEGIAALHTIPLPFV
jgi:hypothetical protein